MARLSTLEVATDAEINFIKEQIERIAEQRGIKIDHPELMEYVRKTGAEVDERQDGAYIRFPKSLQKELLARAKNRFILAGRDQEYDLVIPHPDNLFYTRPVMGSMHITTADGEERLVSIKDIAEYAQLIDELEHINMYNSLTYGLGGLPPTATDINCLYQNLNNGRKKHAHIQPYEAANVKYVLEMAAVVAGGEEKLAVRPIISSFSAATEPFMLVHMDCESLVRYAELGMPINCGCIPTSGANAPITPAGNVIMGAAQNMMILFLTQCVYPGLPVYTSVQPLLLDMMSTYTLQSNPHTHVTRMLANQVMKEGYDLPHLTTGGGSDSFIPGAESAANVAMTTLNSALSGATFLSNHGMCQTFKRYSPLQLIVDNEIIAMVKSIMAGCTVDDEAGDMEELLAICERESFIDKNHNLRHFQEVYRPRIFSSISREQWEAAGAKDLFQRAQDIYSDFRKNYRPRTIEKEMKKELDKIVVRANKELAGVAIDMKSFGLQEE